MIGNNNHFVACSLGEKIKQNWVITPSFSSLKQQTKIGLRNRWKCVCLQASALEFQALPLFSQPTPLWTLWCDSSSVKREVRQQLFELKVVTCRHIRIYLPHAIRRLKDSAYYRLGMRRQNTDNLVKLNLKRVIRSSHWFWTILSAQNWSTEQLYLVTSQ